MQAEVAPIEEHPPAGRSGEMRRRCGEIWAPAEERTPLEQLQLLLFGLRVEGEPEKEIRARVFLFLFGLRVDAVVRGAHHEEHHRLWHGVRDRAHDRAVVRAEERADERRVEALPELLDHGGELREEGLTQKDRARHTCCFTAASSEPEA